MKHLCRFDTYVQSKSKTHWKILFELANTIKAILKWKSYFLPWKYKYILGLMVSPPPPPKKKTLIMDFLSFFNSENKALGSFQSVSGVQLKVHRGSIESAPGFIWRRIKLGLVHSRLNPGTLLFEPHKNFVMIPGLYFQNWKKSKKCHVSNQKW